MRNARNEDTPVLAQQLQGSKCNDKSVVAPIVRRIEETAQGILDARTLYPDCSLADLYNETTMVPELRKAHQANDQVIYYVFTNIYTHCDLTDSTITATSGTEMDGAFEFRVLNSSNDSLRILFANHTNLDVQPIFFPSVDTDSTSEAHPLARSGSSDEAQYMRKRARLKGGQAMLFTIPTTWDVSRINKYDCERYKSGRLVNGRYKIGLQIEVYMNKEIWVKAARRNKG